MIIPTSGLGGEEQKRIHLERLNLMASFPWKTSSWLWRQGPEDEANPCPPPPLLGAVLRVSPPLAFLWGRALSHPHYESPSSSPTPVSLIQMGAPPGGSTTLALFSAHCNDCLIAVACIRWRCVRAGSRTCFGLFTWALPIPSKGAWLTETLNKKKKKQKKNPNAEWINGAKSIIESLTHTHKRSERREWEQSWADSHPLYFPRKNTSGDKSLIPCAPAPGTDPVLPKDFLLSDHTALIITLLSVIA